MMLGSSCSSCCPDLCERRVIPDTDVLRISASWVLRDQPFLYLPIVDRDYAEPQSIDITGLNQDVYIKSPIWPSQNGRPWGLAIFARAYVDQNNNYLLTSTVIPSFVVADGSSWREAQPYEVLGPTEGSVGYTMQRTGATEFQSYTLRLDCGPLGAYPVHAQRQNRKIKLDVIHPNFVMGTDPRTTPQYLSVQANDQELNPRLPYEMTRALLPTADRPDGSLTVRLSALDYEARSAQDYAPGRYDFFLTWDIPRSMNSFVSVLP